MPNLELGNGVILIGRKCLEDLNSHAASVSRLPEGQPR
jgi:hypothetical protein